MALGVLKPVANHNGLPDTGHGIPIPSTIHSTQPCNSPPIELPIIVKDKTCLNVDDIIDSGGTIVNAAKALKARGAKEVYVYITHGVLSGDAVKKIKNSVIKNLVITDTINNHDKTKNVKNIEVLPISGLMGEAIKRISNSTSVSDLFK